MQRRYLGLLFLLPWVLGHSASPAPSRCASATEMVSITSPSCISSQVHPISIDVRLVDELVPERWVTAEIAVTSEVDVSRVDVDLTATSGVELLGARSLALGGLEAGATARAAVQLRVPDDPDQRQLQLVANASHEAGTLQRGASLNLLPRGPHHPAVHDAVQGKSRQVVEYPGAARRLP